MTANSDKTSAEFVDRIWELTKSIRMCMLVSWDGQKQRARPMASRVRREKHAIYFLDKTDSAKEQQIKQYPTVALTYADTGSNKYVTMAGLAKVSNDRALIKELWDDMDKAWFDSPEDPSMRVITFTPEEAELWDSPNRMVATAIMLTSAVTGMKPDMGDNVKVAI